MSRDFNPSNEPQTCLYCGSKLRHTVYKEATYTKTISLCCQAPVDRRMARDSSIAGWRDSVVCTRCDRELIGDSEDTEQAVTVVPEKRSPLAGYDGLFCTLNCGYRFGRLAARQGVRYTKTAPSPHQEDDRG